MKLTTTLLALGLVLAAPAAFADEKHPDCEEYQDTYFYPDNTDEEGNRQKNPEKTRVCEGEHWDGQDTTNSSDEPTQATTDGENTYVSLFAYKDPESPDVDQNGVLDAFHMRLSMDGSEHVYFYGGLYGVGETAADVNTADKRAAWYGKDGTNQGPLGPVWMEIIDLYNRDDADADGADGNFIAWVVGESGMLPQGMATGENDCTQHEYQTSDCTRDNTAITMELA